jgi:glucose-6-phosphate isomerase
MNDQTNNTREVTTSSSTLEIREMLQKCNKKLSDVPLSELISEPGRFRHFSSGIDGLLLDYSRVHIDRETLELLFLLARKRGVSEARDGLFRGESVNFTEHRPAMHMALRSRELGQHLPAGEFEAMEQAMEQMLLLAESLHRGVLPSDGQTRVRNILHVGIGGSMLGTRLLCEALCANGDDVPDVHFLGSVDAHHRESLLPDLSPAETVVVLASKSFTTTDTLMHGQRILDWLSQGLGQKAAYERAFAVTCDRERALSLGVPGSQILHLPEWVGGRYSLWSPVSLAAAAVMGPDTFRQLLRGAAAMDRHFLESAAQDNLPLLMGLLGFWHRNICGYGCWGVIPYDQRLRLLPAHLQQLIMESNGKTVNAQGQPVRDATAPLVFGECGTDAQHSLFQALHQGFDRVPLNLVGVIRAAHADSEAHAELLANFLAQATALATGRTIDETRQQVSAGEALTPELLAHRSFEGNRPSELLLLDDLGAVNLGKLLALYEHKVFVESVIWGVNAFDQWGVELGKTLAPAIRHSLEEGGCETASLEGLLDYIRQRG